jgi:hypothetical protein
MLVPHESRLVSANRPVKPLRRPPPLLRTHTPKNGDLLRAGLFVGQHIGMNLGATL